MAEYSDDFERASLGANWTTAQGTPQIFDSSDFGGASGATASVAIWAGGDAAGANQYAECVFSVLTGNGPEGARLFIRMDASGNGYQATYSADGFILYRLDAGVGTQIDSGGETPSTGQTIRLEANGSTIRVLLAGTEVGTATDSTHTAGRGAYLGIRGDAGRIESWGFGDLGAAIVNRSSLESAMLKDTVNVVTTEQAQTVISADRVRVEIHRPF